MPSNSKAEPMLPGRLYHYYTRTSTNEKLFRDAANYNFFLNTYKRFTLPVCSTAAYCLLPNHFHVVIRIKSEEELEKFYLRKYKQRLTDRISVYEWVNNVPNKEFSNMLNSYAQAFNKYHKRRGKLFDQSHKLREISGLRDLKTCIAYVHNNPSNHGIVPKPEDWTFSSIHFWNDYKQATADSRAEMLNKAWISMPAVNPMDVL